jgi:pSer/pThr/pTyr-binding forkhead associated (FHA) protein
MAVLVHKKADGTELKLQVGGKPLVFGRGLEADIRVEDEEVSRSHCAIWMEGDKFLIKDLRSRNGTFVNGKRITETTLAPKDRVKIGHCEFAFEQEAPKGFTTMIRQVEDEMMGKGKGFSTILREVVSEMPKDKRK